MRGVKVAFCTHSTSCSHSRSLDRFDATQISGLKGLLDSALFQQVKGEELDIIEVQRLHLIINCKCVNTCNEWLRPNAHQSLKSALQNLFLSFARGHITWCHYTRYLFITDVMKEVEVLSELN